MSLREEIEKIKWKPEYNIGNLKIDKEHQNLFSLAQKALTITTSKDADKEKNELITIIKTLIQYVKTHFTNEETYMQEIKYPDLQKHKELHQTMLTTLTTLISHLNNLDIKEIEDQLYHFIEEYFIKHIIMEDKKMHLWIMPMESLRKSFGWKEIYKVGYDQIDQEHKQLFDIAQEAFNIVDSSTRADKIKSVIADLYDYMKTHFNHEEEFMETIKYPKLEEHKKLHEQIIINLNSFIQQLSTLNLELFEKELARLIDILLVQHIIQEDRKIMSWYYGNKN